MATQRRRLPSITNRITKIPSVVIYLFFLFKSWVLVQIRRRGRNIRRSSDDNPTDHQNYIAELPDPIMCDILSRLPLNSIFTCRRVCKAWRNLLLEPHFATLHLSRSPLSLFFYSDGHNSNSCSSFEIFEIDDPPRVALHRATITILTWIYQPNIHTKIAASCNGSFVVSNRNNKDENEILIVCNPLRRHHFVLPVPPKSSTPQTKDLITRFGLGYSPLTHQYKVLRLACTRSRARLDSHIFTFGMDDQWRRIDDTRRAAHSYVSNVVFLNGALHWIGGTEDSQLICYFDIEKEQFGSVPLPNSEIEKYSSIGVVDNRLYLDNLYYNDDVWKFWVLKDYRDFGSWTLEWIIEGPFNGLARPLKMLKDGSLLMMFNKLIPRADAFETTLASFNPQTRELKEIEYGGILPWGPSYADVPCFYSPMDALKGQCFCL